MTPCKQKDQGSVSISSPRALLFVDIPCPTTSNKRSTIRSRIAAAMVLATPILVLLVFVAVVSHR